MTAIRDEHLLRTILDNGRGIYFSKCQWCHRSTTASKLLDALTLLAEVKREGWLVERAADGKHDLSCPSCVVLRGLPKKK